MTAFDADAYLKRIGLAEPPAPTVEGLQALQRAQVLAIPFENFDILLGRGISLEPEAVFDKLVRRRRGGYCFEINDLLLSALQAFGFEARALLGRVHLMGQTTGRSHQISLVTIDGEDWIADAGFGAGTALAPLKFVLDQPQAVPGSLRRYVADPVFGTMLQVETPEGWSNLYSFDLEQVVDADRAMGNWFTSTNPQSFFTWARVAARQTPDGRVTLMDYTMKVLANGEETVTRLEEGEPYLTALRDHFGIEIDTPYEAIRPIVGDGADFSV